MNIKKILIALMCGIVAGFTIAPKSGWKFDLKLGIGTKIFIIVMLLLYFVKLD